MREEKQNGRKGRAYLNDFVVSDDGKYIYQGITYRFDGDNSSKRRRYAYTNGVMQSVKNYVEHPEEIKDISF